MRTRLTIMAIILAAAAATIGVVVVLVVMFGWLGLAIGALGTIAVLVAYRLWIQPWQHRWGATDDEAHPDHAGDDLISDAAGTTRAISIAAGGCRLVSRWRVDWPLTPATAFRILLSDPGAFIMERKMLKGIRSRAEATVRAAERRHLASGRS